MCYLVHANLVQVSSFFFSAFSVSGSGIDLNVATRLVVLLGFVGAT